MRSFRIGVLFENLEYGPAPEAVDSANAWLDDHDREFGNFINNQVCSLFVSKFPSKLYHGLNIS